MRFRSIALLLILAVMLAACAPFAQTEVETTTEMTASPEPSETPTGAPATTGAPVTTEATEAPTEATEAPTEASPDVDLGVVDGSSYRNETLGITCTLPEGWYLYNETDIAALNNLVEETFDSEAIRNALTVGQSVIIFCASHPTTLSSVSITVSKNTTLGMSEEALVAFSLSMMKSQLEQSGVMQNVVCAADEAEFCGQKHTVLKVSGEAPGMHLYETVFYLTCGDLLYNVTVSTTDEAAVAEILDLFEPID